MNFLKKTFAIAIATVMLYSVLFGLSTVNAQLTPTEEMWGYPLGEEPSPANSIQTVNCPGDPYVYYYTQNPSSYPNQPYYASYVVSLGTAQINDYVAACYNNINGVGTSEYQAGYWHSAFTFPTGALTYATIAEVWPGYWIQYQTVIGGWRYRWGGSNINWAEAQWTNGYAPNVGEASGGVGELSSPFTVTLERTAWLGAANGGWSGTDPSSWIDIGTSGWWIVPNGDGTGTAINFCFNWLMAVQNAQNLPANGYFWGYQ